MIPTAQLAPPVPGTTRLIIRNMVCGQCVRAVRHTLESLGLAVSQVVLGAADVAGPVPDAAAVRQALQAAGFELVENPAQQLVEQVKAVVVELIHYTPAAELRHNFSVYLTQRLGRDYHYLSQQFSAQEGLTLEKFIIRQKVERAKELLSYQEATVAEVASQLGYSSAAYFTNQFRQVTGMSPTEFQQLGPGSASRRSLDAVTGAKPRRKPGSPPDRA
jgi:AraC family transcriptional regulator